MLFLTLVNAAWCMAAWLWFDRPTWLWLTPIALSINALLLTYDQVLTFSEMPTLPLRGQDPWGLLKLVEELSEAFKVNAPPVFLIPHPSAQVFCYGKTRRHPRLFVTEGAIKLLSPEELRAVLIYQMCVMTSSVSLINYWLGASLDLCLRAGRGIEKAIVFIFGWSPKVSKWVVAPWIWILQRTLISSKDFHLLDKEAAARLQNPKVLAQALWKMEAYAQNQPWRDPWVFAHMCMVSPLAMHPVLNSLRVQPNLKSRIKELTGHYPL